MALTPHPPSAIARAMFFSANAFAGLGLAMMACANLGSQTMQEHPCAKRADISRQFTFLLPGSQSFHLLVIWTGRIVRPVQSLRVSRPQAPQSYCWFCFCFFHFRVSSWPSSGTSAVRTRSRDRTMARDGFRVRWRIQQFPAGPQSDSHNPRFHRPPYDPGRSDFPSPVLTLAYPFAAFPRRREA